MLYSTLVLNLVIVAGLAIVFNLAALVAVLVLRKGRSIKDNPSLVPLLCLLLIDFGLSFLLAAPLYSFLSEIPFFDWLSCQVYGGLDMALSLSQFLLACLIAFDRYVASLSPKWGHWRCHSNYIKVIFFAVASACVWSFVPVLGYGRYDTFLNGHFCSLDWKQGDLDSSPEAAEHAQHAHHYIGFLTATCLVFFLIPVCIASALYYSIIDHIDRLNNADVRDDSNATGGNSCTWAPKNHIAKVGLGCLLSSTLPYLAYSIVCLNPMKSDFKPPSYVVAPALISRLSTVLNPILYVLFNPEIIPIEAFLAKRQARRRPPPKTYHTINLMMNVPGVSFPLLTPTIPRRQLPRIPPHLASPSKRPENSVFYGETYPML